MDELIAKWYEMYVTVLTRSGKIYMGNIASSPAGVLVLETYEDVPDDRILVRSTTIPTTDIVNIVAEHL